MKLHELEKNLGATHRKKIVGRGRGSGLGKTSGRGEKGQKHVVAEALIPYLKVDNYLYIGAYQNVDLVITDLK